MPLPVLEQRVRISLADLPRHRASNESSSALFTFQEIRERLTLQQRQLSPLAQPGTLNAWAVDGSDLLVPKAWALENRAELGILEGLRDDQFPPEDIDRESMQLTLPHGLRPHQLEAVQAVVDEFESTQYGGGACITMYCGAGKSVTALAVAARMGVKTLIITHTSVLAAQWREAILQYCPSAKVGSIVQDTFEVRDCTHVVGSLHSLAGRDYSMHESGIQLVCVDEAHHISALQLSEAINKVGSRYRLGLSATPIRPDGLSPFMCWSLGREVFRLNRPRSEVLRAYFIRVTDTPVVTKLVTGPKEAVNMAAMINCLSETSPQAEARQELCASWIRLCSTKGRKIIVVADRIGLLKNLERRVCSSSLTTSFLLGETKKKERQTAREAQVIFGSYGLVSEGLDIPSLDTVLLLTPRSGANCIQQVIGRLMREGGRSPLIIDFVDSVPLFEGMYRKRERIYKKMGAAITSYDENRNVIAS